ncbi:F-box/LRR-repeat MAX2 homolog A-like [Lycium ferocissimum]|uniref:F-box/LRR-repeat MAX2 homolog A-like n=1 Tax=Lycium ferocissimum TaxID=112874 RepID=UPI0028154CF2|nr:F-box/LRR-repeat MAX2 homolog A-like [Lycium ferocissimum]
MATASTSRPPTTINDLPDVILSNIIAAISDSRSRNSTSLACRKFLVLERSTRLTLTLRGNTRDLFMLPTCFRSVTHLDLSLLSPWGHPLLSPRASRATEDDPDSTLIAHLLRHAFPSVHALTLYARDPHALRLLPAQWPQLKHVKLVRWHQRPQLLANGDEFNLLFQGVPQLSSLDLSTFYCWTDDIPIALELNPIVSRNLTLLNLMNASFSEGFKTDDIRVITKCCPNLTELKIACMFDPRYIGFVGDEALVCISNNCPKLSVLHLADTSVLSNCRADPDDEGFTEEDAKFSVSTLIEVFSGLSLLEELVLDVCNNVRDSGPALEILNTKCPKLRSLKLGQFHGVSMAIESKLDGVALCQGLESLSIRNVGDLNDMGLIAIGRGCTRLAKFEIQSCKKITMRGMRTLASLLRKSLVDVRISRCKNLGASSSLKALEPIQERIERLHIDCVWDSVEEIENLNGVEYGFDLNETNGGEASSHGAGFGDTFGTMDDDIMFNRNKRCKYDYDLNSVCTEDNGYGNGFGGRTWDRLQYLSLWIGVGDLLTPLADAGLQHCPNLEEIKIRVEGDCRLWSKPSERAFGLSTLSRYHNLVKMHLDCGDIIGYAHTAPSGQMDLSLWERFYLFGIGNLNLRELDYWPPQDRDVNQRSLSLPAAGLLQECIDLRKLFIHGTAHEHFMMFLLRIPNLRDVQLREDYYPAPENDMSTEMRSDSLSRFEAALNRRQICD